MVIIQAVRDWQTAKILASKSPAFQAKLEQLEEFFAGGGTWPIWGGDLDGAYILERADQVRRGREQ